MKKYILFVLFTFLSVFALTAQNANATSAYDSALQQATNIVIGGDSSLCTELDITDNLFNYEAWRSSYTYGSNSTEIESFITSLNDKINNYGGMGVAIQQNVRPSSWSSYYGKFMTIYIFDESQNIELKSNDFMALSSWGSVKRFGVFLDSNHNCDINVGGNTGLGNDDGYFATYGIGNNDISFPSNLNKWLYIAGTFNFPNGYEGITIANSYIVETESINLIHQTNIKVTGSGTNFIAEYTGITRTPVVNMSTEGRIVMENIILQFFKYAVRTTVIIGVVITFTILISTLITMINIGLNLGLINDLIAMLQLWLPFNFGQLFSWLFVLTGLYLSYRTSYWIMIRINEYIS